MKKQIYLIGIKGVAMTSTAVYLQEMGCEVSGSDISETFVTDKILEKHQIRIKKGFSPSNISNKYDLAIVTGAHGGMTNVEALQAIKMNIPALTQGEYLGKLMNNKKGISIAGCHGKTTTASITASLLFHAGFDPSYIIGTAQINDLGAGGHFGNGEFFVAEADEYMTCPTTDKTPRFCWQKPNILIVTNIEYDHPDAYKNLNEVKETFIKYINSLQKNALLITCIDNVNIRKILPQIKIPYITYGFSSQADFQVSKYYIGEKMSIMRIKNNKVDFGEYIMRIPGKHNLLNGLAACIAVNQAGITWDKIKNILKLFTGCNRRYEKKAEINGIILFDDYAHHPSEIKATILATREWNQGKRIIIIFQPHTFSRTKELLGDFAQAFKGADLAIITDIYPSAREKMDTSISSKMLVSLANQYKKNIYYRKDKKSVINFLKENIKKNDLIMTMGAGDIFLWDEEIIKILRNKSNE